MDWQHENMDRDDIGGMHGDGKRQKETADELEMTPPGIAGIQVLK